MDNQGQSDPTRLGLRTILWMIAAGWIGFLLVVIFFLCSLDADVKDDVWMMFLEIVIVATSGVVVLISVGFIVVSVREKTLKGWPLLFLVLIIAGIGSVLHSSHRLCEEEIRHVRQQVREYERKMIEEAALATQASDEEDTRNNRDK